MSDFSSLKQVRELAEKINEEHDQLHVLINNPGVYMRERRLTKDGLETTFQVNFLSHFLLTNMLLPLKKSKPSRIIMVTSDAHWSARVDWDNLNGEKSYDSYAAYSLSKLAQVLFTYELAKRLEGTGVTVNCLHPGAINTKLNRTGWGGASAGVEQGAQTPVYLASSPEVDNVTGKYFRNKQPVSSSSLSYDKALQKKFWSLAEKLVGVN